MDALTPTALFHFAVEQYADTLYRVALHAAPRPEDAEDAVQDTYEKLLHCGKTFENETHLKAWLIRVVINRCHDLCRLAESKNLSLEEASPAHLESAPGQNSELLELVLSLPENYRTAIYLHYYEGYTAAEIGAMQEVSTNTVLTWLSRGRSRLRKLLKEDMEDEMV